MKFLYYISLIIPYFLGAIGGFFYLISCVFVFIAGWVHDKTAYRAWFVLHQRECDKVFKK